MAGDSLDFRLFRNGDEGAILRLLRREKEAQSSLDEWAWSFPPEADGRAIVVGEADGGVVAVCAGVPIRVVVDGRMRTAVEIRQVAARDRDGAREVVEQFVEISKSNGQFDLAITSLDVDREVLIGFDVVQRDRSFMLKRERSGLGGLRRLFYRAEPARDWEPRLDRLWELVGGSYQVAIARDADGWLRRFAGHPTRRHHRFLVCQRFSHDAVAAAVFAIEDDRCRWLDLIWDHGHPGALELLCHISGRLARQFDADSEEVWLAGDEQAADILATRRFERRQAPSFVAAVAFDPQIDAADLVDRIYLTPAEMGAGDR
jgi:hypothetical protein